MSEGMQCPGCQETHTDWEKTHEAAVNDGGYHSGTVEVFECGKCGEKVEQPRP